MKEKFSELYTMMSESSDVKKMKVFGSVLKEMMGWFIVNRPEQAEEFIETLCSIKWKNYLTKKEAQSIVDGMKPKSPWTFSAWDGMMSSMGEPKSEEPHYNEYALWVAMSMVYSDSRESIEKIADRALDERELFGFVHCLAIDKLEDEDGVFNIRKYFNVE